MAVTAYLASGNLSPSVHTSYIYTKIRTAFGSTAVCTERGGCYLEPRREVFRLKHCLSRVLLQPSYASARECYVFEGQIRGVEVSYKIFGR